MGGGDFVLYEAASGYALVEVAEFEEIGSNTQEVQQTVADLARFSRLVKLKVGPKIDDVDQTPFGGYLSFGAS